MSYLRALRSIITSEADPCEINQKINKLHTYKQVLFKTVKYIHGYFASNFTEIEVCVCGVCVVCVCARVRVRARFIYLKWYQDDGFWSKTSTTIYMDCLFIGALCPDNMQGYIRTGADL